jgi:hypothetical protein
MVLLMGGCRGQARPADDASAHDASVPPVPGDTQAQPVPVAPPTMGPETPARPGVPAATPGSAGAGAAKTPPSPYIGYDSAFGPSFELDSTGKAVPIKTKKPGGDL